MLETTTGTLRLSPAYDLLCSEAVIPFVILGIGPWQEHRRTAPGNATNPSSVAVAPASGVATPTSILTESPLSALLLSQ